MRRVAGRGSVVFLHAHPDDEAIFTGGTLLRLAENGTRTCVVFATDGALSAGDPLAAVRRDEAGEACALLGVDRVEFLGYVDSGLDGGSTDPGAFAGVATGPVVARLARLLVDEAAAALVVYDDGGIYGHPDHLAVHRHGVAAAVAAGVDTVYECTVDREYLHFVETHLVGHAVNSLLGDDAANLSTNRAPLGVPTVEVTTTVDVRAQCAKKRAAMAAHRSQIPAGSEALCLPPASFDGIYGFEWYVRRGPVGPLEVLAF